MSSAARCGKGGPDGVSYRPWGNGPGITLVTNSCCFLDCVDSEQPRALMRPHSLRVPPEPGSRPARPATSSGGGRATASGPPQLSRTQHTVGPKPGATSRSHEPGVAFRRAPEVQIPNRRALTVQVPSGGWGSPRQNRARGLGPYAAEARPPPPEVQDTQYVPTRGPTARQTVQGAAA
ncbi:hypothetical protein NDU88_000182 [Pleurodeles waltl]|uniref:Uncharacterized protein n=1 Tax=Pleurodeles waltl TaxID=8319 RepID=A0AAV7UP98_PLEWA|nr:hypothetical protein NDU88_000182 [Pleurodeles waltl]